MEPAPPARTTSPIPKSLLERAYKDARDDTRDAPADRPDDEDTTRTRILDAAYEQFCRLGIQRSSMEEVARRANLSRITLYRKFDTKDALVDQVVLREFRRYFVRFLAEVEQAETVADRVVFGFVSSLRAIRTNPLIGSLLETEPTLLAGAIGGADGWMLAAVRRFVAGQLRLEQQSGNVPETLDTELVAEMMVRVSASFLTIASHIVDLDDDTELASVARQFLVPMLDPPPSP